eukprot:12412481-Karenia_brevis.AAC.1
MGHHYAFVILKTVTGGWITTRRIQHSVKTCIFCGSDSGDCMQHMFECDTLWHAIGSSFVPFVPHFLHPDLLGLAPLSPYQIYGIAIAYQVYHSCRHDGLLSFPSLISHIKAEMRGDPVCQHLVKAHFGKVQLKYSLSSSSSEPSALRSSEYTDLTAPSSPPPIPSESTSIGPPASASRSNAGGLSSHLNSSPSHFSRDDSE